MKYVSSIDLSDDFLNPPYDSLQDLLFIIDFSRALGIDLEGMVKYDLRRENSLEEDKHRIETRRARVA